MSDNLPPLKPDLEGHEYELWGQNMRGDFVTVEKAKAYARAALEASRAAVPAEWKVIAVTGFDDLIMALDRADSKGYMPDAIADQYGSFDYCKLYQATQPVAQPTNEAALLRSQIALALEEMSCANFNSAAERLRHVTEVTQAKPEQAAQQERPPLTSAEIADLWDGTLFHITDLSTATDFVRDVEAAHGIAASPKPKD